MLPEQIVLSQQSVDKIHGLGHNSFSPKGIVYMEPPVELIPKASKDQELPKPLESELISGVDGFNATMFPVMIKGKPITAIIHRKGIEDSPPIGKPDINFLKMTPVLESRLSSASVHDTRIIYDPRNPIHPTEYINFEDFRAAEDGFSGLTAVKQVGSDFVPYPAVVQFPTFADSIEEAFGTLPKVSVFESLGKGKNFTPLRTLPDGRRRLLFRPDGKNHTLQEVEIGKDLKEARVVNELKITPPKWGEYKIGTGGASYWLDEKTALVQLHGINLVPSSTATDGHIYYYRIGWSLMEIGEDDNLEVVKIADEAAIDPLQLGHVYSGRFPLDRIIAYSCGFQVVDKEKEAIVETLLNVGDKVTELFPEYLSKVCDSVGYTGSASLPKAA